MTDTSKLATPPGEGRTDHGTMRDAMHRPVTAAAGLDTLAANQGLELPAGESHSTVTDSGMPIERIPGERDSETLTARQPGSMGGRGSGADTPSADPHHVMDDATIHDRTLEGGGR
jgi:hypothetical protein